ncbi:bifunctional alpha/beta hydrolase/OsmC family protein [Ornithinimicrobium sediminis]|uniref:bifunctional alpha/beta hydrolase/OsmC family protein n=1 Tax=Ornithinimicrobium sediminis TaxID=2904603 RepID=UPI001E2A6811|nr:bifunctional alpha/beta hydrolase/OsmC family protein [Ornithinimicrobium sediminis]MCE0486548.1 bifunctional alpha/beta hydrolase/OsmC family protein [Ornithinimicrobium sediminis]
MRHLPHGSAPTRITDIVFPGALGTALAATLELPAGRPRAFAVFAHCFTCTSESRAASRISGALAGLGHAVLRFDFTGLGRSGGDFSHTSFTTNVDDLVAAADWLADTWGPASLLVGHSLGGAAVIAAEARIPSVQAVATLGAPADTAHVTRLLSGGIPDEDSLLTVDIGGRPFTVSRQFLDDVATQPQAARLRALRGALLVLHSPDDDVVGVENARTIFDQARHPKSFVSLDGADHLLSRREDSHFAASMIAAWAHRHLPLVGGDATGKGQLVADDAPSPLVTVREQSEQGMVHVASIGRHSWLIDEPVSAGGEDLGGTPYDVLLSALGACTSMTMRMYAHRKGWEYSPATVTLRHRRVHAMDCATCETTQGMVDQIDREITLDPRLSAEQQEALLAIADKCPVHRTLSREVVVMTQLAGETSQPQPGPDTAVDLAAS